MARAGGEGRPAVGIDLGGTNLRMALYRGLDQVAGGAVPEPVTRRREPVGERRDPETIVERLAAAIEWLCEEAGCGAGPVPIGVGIAAMLHSATGVVANSPHLRWRNVRFAAMLRDRLGPDYPVFLYNDANAITYGEYALGAARGASDVLGVFIGTGIGAGIVAGGQLVEGQTGCAAEIGHVKVVVDDSAQPCACGLRGCVEAYAGGAYLQRRIRAELAGGARSLAVALAGGTTDAVHPGHLDAAAAEGDEYALSLYAEISPLVALALANAITLLNPGRLVLGGGMLSRMPVLREHIVAGLEVVTNPPALAELEIVDAALEDDAGLLGSALLALRTTS
jgi:glucokinase